MAYLLVLLVLIIGAFYLMQTKLGIDKTDTDIMCFGIMAFGTIEVLAKILIGLFTGATGSMLLALLIMLAINGGIAYYFFKKSGL